MFKSATEEGCLWRSMVTPHLKLPISQWIIQSPIPSPQTPIFHPFLGGHSAFTSGLWTHGWVFPVLFTEFPPRSTAVSTSEVQKVLHESTHSHHAYVVHWDSACCQDSSIYTLDGKGSVWTRVKSRDWEIHFLKLILISSPPPRLGKAKTVWLDLITN